MGEVIGSILPAAIAIALSPGPILALVLMLTAVGGTMKAWAFIVGSFVGLIIPTVIFTLVATSQHVDKADTAPSTVAALVQLALGLCFLAFAYKQWTGRPRAGERAKPASWMKKIDTMSVMQSFGFGAAFMGISSKNLPLISSAGLTIARANLSGVDVWISMIVLCIVGVLSMAALALAPVFLGARGDRMLVDVNEFMTQNANVILMMLFVILGFNFIGKAIGGLTS